MYMDRKHTTGLFRNLRRLAVHFCKDSEEGKEAASPGGQVPRGLHLLSPEQLRINPSQAATLLRVWIPANGTEGGAACRAAHS